MFLQMFLLIAMYKETPISCSPVLLIILLSKVMLPDLAPLVLVLGVQRVIMLLTYTITKVLHPGIACS